MLNHSDSRKALGYFLDEYRPSTPAETKARTTSQYVENYGRL
jgi:hypothetical protein